MLKLMKYEFRKMRTALIALLLGLLALELGFILGNTLDKEALEYVSLALLSLMVFGTYGYILISGVVSYSRELNDRTGYLTFMTPTRPIGIVLSKLVYTLLVGSAATALFALVAWLDYAYLARSMNLDGSLLDQLNLSLKFMLGDMRFSLTGLFQAVAFTVLSVLIEVMLMMCTAYLAITVSATALQNRRGFLRALVSVVLFGLITWGSTWVTDKITDLVPRALPTDSPASMDMVTLVRMLSVSLALHLALGGVFAAISAHLLKRKVSL